MTPRQRLTELLRDILSGLATAKLAVIRLGNAETAVRACIREAEERPAAAQEDIDQLADMKDIRRAMAGVVDAGRKMAEKEAFAALDAEFAEPPAPPPVEVEMRLKAVPGNRWLWQCRFEKHGVWVEQSNTPQRACIAEDAAQLLGRAWLAALSEQLDIKLKAMWPETADAEMR